MNIFAGAQKKLKNKLTKEKFSFGLDIGTNTVKVVKLRLTPKEPQLCAFKIEPSQLDLGDMLKDFKQSYGADSVNISLSGPTTALRYISFPKMNYHELKKALKFEAQKYIPFPVSEINLDAHILADNLPDNKMLILIAAAKKDLVNNRIKAIEAAGIKAHLVDMDALALANSFIYNYPDKASFDHNAAALLNIGASNTNLDILQDGILRLSRDIHLAGNFITQKIADILAIDFKAAENLKIAPTNPELAKKVTMATEAALVNLAGEIRTSFDFYESQSSSQVVKIYLSGGAVMLSGLREMLVNLLGMEIENWDPLKQISMAEGVDPEKAKAASNQLAVATGLALR